MSLKMLNKVSLKLQVTFHQPFSLHKPLQKSQTPKGQHILFYVIHPWVVRKSHAVHIKWKNYDDLGALLFEITHRINGIADAFLSMVPVKTLKSVLVLRAHSARKHAITQNGSSVPVLPEAMQDQAEQCWYSVLGDTDNWEGYSIHPHIFHTLSYGRIPSSNAYVAS